MKPPRNAILLSALVLLAILAGLWRSRPMWDKAGGFVEIPARTAERVSGEERPSGAIPDADEPLLADGGREAQVPRVEQVGEGDKVAPKPDEAQNPPRQVVKGPKVEEKAEAKNEDPPASLPDAEVRIAELLSRPLDLSDPKNRAELAAKLRALEDAKAESIAAKAKRLGIPTEIVGRDGRKLVLVGFDGDLPRYIADLNINAAISSGARKVRNVAPFQANGLGLVFGLWEVGGVPRTTHQEFGSPSKVTVKDGAITASDHATHVAGTLAGLGTDPAALGMAPAATIDAYDHTNDLSEMLLAGAAVAGEAGKILVSNHSYGLIRGWNGTVWYGTFTDNGNAADDIDTRCGRYDASSASIDGVLSNLPYYLPFWSSGNDRSNAAPGTGVSWTVVGNSTVRTYDPAQHPAGDGVYKGGYDLLDYRGTCKNLMTIGAAHDAVTPAGVRLSSNATLTSFSSTGSADDGRIKPDVVANGQGLYSPLSISDTAYDRYNGTSMAAPNAAGSTLLLIDYYRQRNPGGDLRASTLKGLLIHTAEDLGRAGPDYEYGWGMINIQSAANLIRAQADLPAERFLVEDLLTSGGTKSYTITWDGSSPIRATLSWTDPAGTGVSAHDDRAPDLVNDLNLSISGPSGSSHFPFVMPYVGNWSNASYAAPAITGVNTVDNVEQVLITTPPAPGNYTVTVTHAGTLTTGSQAFSLILSGQSDPRPVITSIDEREAPAGQAFSHQITTATAATSYSSSTLPADLVLNPTTGLISGTPSTGGRTNVAVTATNASGSDTQNLALTFTAPASIPFLENFEGELGPFWAITGTATANSTVVSGNEPRSGLRHLVMASDLTGTFARNEFTLTVDVSGTADLELSFWAKEFSDESHGPPATPFTSGADFDGVAISSDGTTWYEVQSLRSEISNTWTRYIVDLDAAIATRGLTRNANFRIRFNHYDNFNVSVDPGSSDGFAFDDIQVSGPLPLITSAASVSGVRDQPFTHQIVTSSPATSFSSGTLPPGLSLNPATGLISGTPTQVGTTNVAITATNANGSDTQTLAINISAAAIFNFANSSSTTIPSSGNASPYPSTISVSGLSGTVAAIRARLNGFSHTYPDDVDVFLMSPSGRVCALMSDAGGTTGVSSVNLVFDDAAASVIPDSTAISSGTYRPANYETVEPLPPGGIGTIGTTLSALSAGAANGTWRLYVSDDAVGFSGSIASWSLEFEMAPPGSSPDIIVQQPEGSGLANGTAVVDFGSVPRPGRTVRRFLLRNSGNFPLTLISPTFSGPQASDFSASSLSSATLAPQASSFFNVTFTPSTTGARQAVLTISSNDPDTPSFVVNLSGTGAALPAGLELLSDINSLPAGFTISNPMSMGSYVLFYGTTPQTGTEVWRSDGTAAGTYLLRDFNPGSASSAATPMARIGNLAYFVAMTPAEGSELWVTDGTIAGTQIVSDIAAGNTSSAPASLTVIGTTLYFSALTSSGRELWRTNGTAAGTVQVADIVPGAGGSSPANFVNLNGTLLFAASTSTAGTELWRSDGTSGGTQLVLDINSGTSNSSPGNLTVLGGNVLFSATTAAQGSELWRSDGTAAGTVLISEIIAGTANPFLTGFIAHNSVLYFWATTASAGQELWRSDGTPGGTYMVRDIYAGTMSGLGSIGYGILNGELYFAGNTLTENFELWKTDGTEAGTVMVKAIYGGTFGSAPQNFMESGGILYFAATNAAAGRELWRTDGTDAGTVLIRDISLGGSSSNPAGMMNVNGALLFAADDGATGPELWRSQGTNVTTVPVGDLIEGSGSAAPASLRNIDGTLFFSANNGSNGNELWRSGGTAASTVLVRDLFTGSIGSTPTSITALGAKAVFAASSSTSTQDVEPHVSDGTSAGTFLLADIVSGTSASSSPANFTSVGNRTVFSATVSATSGTEPWVTDGTSAGTSLLLDINPGTGSSLQAFPTPGFFAFKGNIYFRATTSAAGSELWITDGTTAGTRLVKDIASGSSSSSPGNFAVMNGELYFAATTSANGTELWKTDGTDAGTVLVADVVAGPGSSSPSSLVGVGMALYFSAVGTSSGTELWKSDGTAAGTVLVSDIRSGSASSFPQTLTTMGNIVYFTADDGVNGRELWRSDGTAAGTFLLKDINPGGGASSPAQPVRMGNVIYFTADDGVNGMELWKTNGTGAETVLAGDIYPGSQTSALASLTQVGPRLYFSAVHPITGSELFSVNETVPAQLLVSYPAGTVRPSAASVIDLGPVSVGSSKTITLTLENGGTNRLAISNISLSGRDANQYQVRPVSQSVLFGNDVALVEIVHTPTSTGRKTATLNISSDDPNTPSYTVTLETPKLDQTIDFPPISNQLATNTLTLSASGGASGNPVTFSVNSGPATIGGANLLSFTGAGQVTILASQAGSDDFNPASDVVRTFLVTKTAATVALSGLSQVYDGTSRTVTATTTPAGLPVDLLYGGGVSAPVNAGSYGITATINHPQYQGAASGTLNVAKAGQTIAFSPVLDQLTTDVVNLAATGGGSGNPVTFAVTGGPGVITNDTTLSFTTSGLVSVTASQAGNANFDAAPAVVRTFNVTKAAATVTLAALNQTYDSTARTVTASTNPAALPVTIIYDGATQAPVNAGSYAVVASIDHPVYQGSTTGTLVVAKAAQAISFAPISDQLATATVSLTASGGGSGNPVTFVVSEGPGVIAGGNSLTFTTSGQVSITASQAGNGNYEAAPEVLRSFNVTKAEAAIVLAGLGQTFDGTARTVNATTTPVGLNVNVTYDGGPQAPVNAGSYAISATVMDARYQGAVAATLVVGKAAQSIDFAAISDQLTTATVPLTATGGGSGNPVTFAVSAGPGVIAGGNSLTFTTSGQVSVTASQAGNANYEAAPEVVRSFTVTKATATVTLASLAQTYDATARPVSATTNPGGLTVNFTYDGAAQVPVNAGSYAVIATIDDPVYQGSANGTLVVAKAAQSIDFAAISDQLTTATVPLSATGGGSGNPVTFAVSGGPGVITGGNSLTFTTSGQVSVTASQAGSANYEAAPEVVRSFTVTKASATVTLAGLAQTYDGTARPVSATTNPGGLTVNFTYDGAAQVPVSAGSYAVIATIDDPVYQGSANGTLFVAKAGQSIDFAAISDQLTTATVPLTATGGGSGNPVTFAVSAGPGVIAGGSSLTFTTSGQVSVTASQAGSANYEAAPEVVRSFTVTKATATVTLASLAQTYDATARPVSATTNPGGLTVNFTYDGAAQVPVNAGSYAVIATIDDPVYQGSANGTLVIAKAGQSIDFAAIADQLTTATVPLTATGGGSGNPVTFAVSAGPGVIAGGNSLTFTTSGQVSITASQAGDANYEAAPDLVRSFAVTKAEATVVLGGLMQTYDGTARAVTATTTPEGLAVDIAYDGVPEPPAAAGSYAIVATIDDLIYQGTITGTLLVGKASQAIEFATIPDQLATATVPLTATGGASGNPVTFSVAEGPGSISGGNSLTFTGAGQVSVMASQAGNENYAAAPDVTRTFAVSRANSVITLSNLYQVPNGSPRPVGVATTPSNLTVQVIYNGSETVPSAPGSYSVVATVQDALYQGTASATLVLDARSGKEVEDPVAPALAPQGETETWTNAAVGTYEGLLLSASDNATIVGFASAFRITAPPLGSTSGGGISGSVRLNGGTAVLRGALDASGRILAEIPQRMGGAMTVDLQLTRTEPRDGLALRGQIVWNGVAARADLSRMPFHARFNPVPASLAAAGPYTVLLPSDAGWGDDEPGGDGWATASLTLGGVMTIAGRLGDGVVFTETGYLSDDGELQLYSELYASSPGKGLIAGRVTFRDLPDISDCDGVLQWRKGADTRIPPREPLYPQGFSREVTLIGSRFVPPPAGQRVLTELANTYRNAELSLIGPTAPMASSDAVDRIVSWMANNVFTHHGHHRLRGSANARNGSVTGAFVEPIARTPATAFTGVAFQKQGIAGGVFVRNGASGAVRILPGTFAYETPPAVARIRKPAELAGVPATTGVALEAAAAGLFHGMLSESSQATGALDNLRLSATGAFSGTLWINGNAHGFRGALAADGTVILPVSRGAVLSPVSLSLVLARVDDPAGGYRFTGSVTVDGVAHAISAQRQAVFTTAARAPQEGLYTLLVCAPDGVDPATQPGGDGYGTLGVNYLGNCAGLITMADGTRVTLSGFVGRTFDDAGTPTAEWTFYRSLYGGVVKGYLAGKLTFRSADGGLADLDGEWRWKKPSGALPASVYPAGFEGTRSVVGSRYTPPAAGIRAMDGLEDRVDNIWLRFQGPALATTSSAVEFDRMATWTARNTLTYPGPESIVISFNARSGLLTGSCIDAFTGINVRFGGVLLQSQDLVSGSYLKGAQSGWFGVQER